MTLITIFLYLTILWLGNSIRAQLAVWLRVVWTEVTLKDIQHVAGLEKVQEGFSASCALVGTTGDWSHRVLLLHVLAEPSLWLSIWVVWFLVWSLRAPGIQGRSCWSCGGETIASLSPYLVGHSSHRPEQNQEDRWPPLLKATLIHNVLCSGSCSLLQFTEICAFLNDFWILALD